MRIFVASSARERLIEASAFVRSFSPGAELLVIGASREAADDFVRGLSRELGATFGLHRFSFPQLVSVLATGELASRGLAPASSLGTEAVVARSAFEALERDEIPRLASVSSFPGFARALASTVDELRLARIAPGAVSDDPDLSALLTAVESVLERTSIADRTRMFGLAERGLETSPAFRALPVLLLDVAVRSARERAFLKALLRSSTAAFATVPTGDDETRDALEGLGPSNTRDSGERAAPGSGLERLQEFLFSDALPPASDEDDAVRFFSAPGEGREAVEVSRQILSEAARGVRFDEIAVFVRSPETYSSHLETAFRRARIPAFFARGTKRPDPTGRAFLALLACRAERLSANRFAEYLSFAQVPSLDEAGAPPAGREVWSGPEEESFGPAAVDAAAVQLALPFLTDEGPEARAQQGAHEEEELPADTDGAPELLGTLRAPWKWEQYLVEAAVIGGKERWQRRLRGLEHELARKRAEVAQDDPESPRLPGLAREVENLRHLERFALPVIDALAALPVEGTWGEWLDALGRLAPLVLRRPERVLSVLAEMRPMAAIGPVGIDEVRTVLGPRLSTLEREHPPHRFGRVYVATPEQARGRSFRIVFVPGLAERVFPRRPREDPLLLDAAREALSSELRTQPQRGRDERMLLRLAVGAAEERIVLSYPRVDVVQARPRVPSFYGLDVVRATRGSLPDYAELEREAAEAARARLAWPSPPDPDLAIDAVEHDLAVLGALLSESRPAATKGRARYLLELNEHLARSLRSRWVRWRFQGWSPEDGIVRTTKATGEALAAHRLSARSYSPTALQNFAACPYRFLLAAIHRLEPRAESAALVQLDPLTRGSMIHEIQAQTLRQLQESGALPIAADGVDAALDVLDETVARIAATRQEELAPAIPRVWHDEVDRMRGDLRVWVKQLARDGAEWVPAHFELRFGLPRGEEFDPRSVSEPVVLPGGYQLRGAIDLVERRVGNGQIRVTDFKTGANRTTEGWIVGGGETLQPVLYSFAAQGILESEVKEARLSFCTSRGGFSDRIVPMSDFARHYGKQVLEIIDRAVENGALPPAPRDRACTYCDFRIVCGPHEEVRARQKKKSNLTADLEALRELP